MTIKTSGKQVRLLTVARAAARRAGLLLSCVLLGLATLAARADGPGTTNASGDDVITIDTRTVLRVLSDSPLGINYNYLRDAPSLRPDGSASLEDKMNEMGVRWIRYPGGEKSDWHLFAPPPFVKPAPVAVGSYTRYLKAPLDFDAYIASVRKLGATPYLVTGYDSFERTGLTKAEYLAHAVGWVKYANITKKYGVKYWEIGNETWAQKERTPEEMAVVVREFSRAMKAVDPTIKVGSSINARFIQPLLQNAGDDLDFLSCSMYFSATGYTAYATGKRELIPGPKYADALAQSKYGGKLELIAAEFGAVDFRKDVPMKQKWEGNDLGHAIVIFDMAGQVLCEPRIRCAMFWTTRWMEDMVANRRCYSLGPKNEIMPVGMPLVIWHQFLRKQIVGAVSPRGCQSFASFEPTTGRLSVFVINKGTTERTFDIHINGGAAFDRCDGYLFAGKGPEDTRPKFSKFSTGELSTGGLRQVKLPGTSIAVFDLQRNQRQ